MGNYYKEIFGWILFVGGIGLLIASILYLLGSFGIVIENLANQVSLENIQAILKIRLVIGMVKTITGIILTVVGAILKK